MQMLNPYRYILITLGLALLVGIGCNDDPIVMEPTNGGEAIDLTSIPYNPTPFEVPSIPDFLPLISPEDNPLTEEGIQLGRHLFYDPILSIDSTLSCSSCHFTDLAFTDGKSVSPGVDGIVGPRSSMSLVNIGYNYRGLFWDGRVRTLEEQAVIPIEAKAIAQFERILISGPNSKYDRAINANTAALTPLEQHGFDLFVDAGDEDTVDAECSHCHHGGLFMGDLFFNG